MVTAFSISLFGFLASYHFHQKHSDGLSSLILLSSLYILYLLSLFAVSEGQQQIYYWVLVLPILNIFINRFTHQLVWLVILLIPLLLPGWFAEASFEGSYTNIAVALIVISIMLYFVKEFFLRSEQNIHHLNRELEYQQKIVDSSVPMLKMDLNGQITYASLAISRILGRSVSNIVGKNYTDLKLISLSNDPQVWLSERKFWGGILYSEVGPKSYWLDAMIRPEYDAFSNKTGYLLIAENITRQQSLEKQANHDQLTGALNRRVFDEFIFQTIEEFNRHKDPVCLVLCDIDHFKEVNDTFGHLTGDDILKEFYKLMEENLRQTDSLARWGGEEFAILLPMTDVNQALIVIEKLRQKVEENVWPKNITLTSSFGICQLQQGWSSKEWFEQTDSALYQAKDEGRNRVIVCS
ncbi:diguanylate cyclase [Thiomicrorhabdus sp. 6S3-12]|uniref:sensor domain-containing diguanylate cyclase n=1 Tax=Thiomicrorhabdus sp. 6S3-12 TaxID=2819681 RepID=UPI001AAC5CC1|nr:diguanylate cyclase [Thiomicrorhabdus sp. 6S3-12]MBO1924160.1 diguanylate cyclase [Thiomicrorhabdus sp. 6S3-12]